MKKNFNKHLSVKVMKKLEEQINYYNLKNEFTFFVVHGSIADETYTGFSDLDTFVCISNESFNNSKRIKTLRNFFSNSYKNFILKEVDPTQHHGFFIIPENFLEFYPESYMPLGTLLRGSELIKEQQILFSLRNSKYSLLKSIFSLSSYFIQIEENNILLQNPFDIKRYISRFFMLPVLYNEYFENSFEYKKLVLEKLSSEKEFPGTFLIDIFSNIRNNWNRYEETNLYYILGKPITRETQEYSQKLLNLVMQEQNVLEEIIYE